MIDAPPITSANRAKASPAHCPGWTPGDSRNFFGNHFVYAVVSARARGLSIGINMNPDRYCNFDCAYCEVNRSQPSPEKNLDLDTMTDELQEMLTLSYTGELQNFHCYRNTPMELMQLKHVALSGDGEPTFCPNFLEVVRVVVHIRALGRFPFYKMVLITNSTGLDLQYVQAGLKLFTPHDEIWAKLDAGTQGYMNLVNRPDCPLEKVLQNILSVARQQPVVIQSLFPLLNHQEPSQAEIEQYALRLRDLREAGAQIRLVQIYSATRPTTHPECEHLPLKTLASIARTVRHVAGLKAEVF